MRYGFAIDTKRCIGCHTCSTACRIENNLPAGMWWNRALTEGGAEMDTPAGEFPDATMSYLTVACQHCENPACVKVCPTGAMHQDADTGLVSVDADKCIGCGYCHMACPYNAPKVDREKGHSVKCDGCKERVAAGEKPVCVEACPARALDFGPVDAMSKLGEQADIAPLPAKSYTSPNLYVKPSKDAKPAGDASAKVVNPLEVM